LKISYSDLFSIAQREDAWVGANLQFQEGNIQWNVIFFFLIGKKSILYKKRKAPLCTLVVYMETTYLEIEKRVRKSEKEIYKGWT
jgi:hypothetical protein